MDFKNLSEQIDKNTLAVMRCFSGALWQEAAELLSDRMNYLKQLQALELELPEQQWYESILSQNQRWIDDLVNRSNTLVDEHQKIKEYYHAHQAYLSSN